jgi:iron complex transport system substrate-binding protein
MDKTVKIMVILLLCCAVVGAAALIMGMAWTGEQPSALVGASPTSATGMTSTALNAAVNNTSSCIPVTINQSDGTPITLPCQPERLIVANSDAAELLIALGASDKIVGVDQSTLSVPYIMNKIPNATSIGDWETPNIEEILALHPDAVISYSSYKPKNIDQITAANITVISLDCYKLNTLPSDARALGTLTGTTNSAEDYAQMVEETVAQVNTRVKSIPENAYPTVYFESYTDYTAESNGSGSDEMLIAAGGKNIAGNSSTSYMTVSPEWVVAEQPQYVMKAVSSSNALSLADIIENLKSRQGWNTIPAVQQNRVYAIESGIEYGPKAYIGLVYTAKILHPDIFQDMDPNAMLNDYAGKYVSGTNVSEMVYP